MASSPNHRADRVAMQIKREVNQILANEVHDPRVLGVNITDVHLTGDLSQATIYYSLLSNLASDNDKAAQGLAKVTGFVKRELAKRLTIYKLPDISFKKDESILYGDKIDQLLRGLNKD